MICVDPTFETQVALKRSNATTKPSVVFSVTKLILLGLLNTNCIHRPCHVTNTKCKPNVIIYWASYINDVTSIIAY